MTRSLNNMGPGVDGEVVAVSASATLALLLPELPEHQQEELIGELGTAISACSVLDQKVVDPHEKARLVHKQIDFFLARDMEKTPEQSVNISCKKGCSHCCKIAVSASNHEAELLVHRAKELGIDIDEGKLERQAQKNVDNWSDLSDEDRSCVFLSESGECRVYEDRPAACRKYFAVNEPELCDSKKYKGQQVLIWFSMRAEIIDSAAMTVFGAEHMPTQLLKALRPVETDKPWIIDSSGRVLTGVSDHHE